MRKRKEKFTPGPWVVWVDHESVHAARPEVRNTPGSISGTRGQICDCGDSEDFGDSDDEGKAINRANAHLIASAPEMHKPCKRLDAIFEGVDDMSALDASFFVDHAGEIFKAAMEARDALRKARGE